MNPSDTMTLMLLVAHFLALGVAVMIFLWMFFLHQRAKKFEKIAEQSSQSFFIEPAPPQRPSSWLAIRSINPETVQAALDTHDFSISAPVNGWVIVTGTDLPTPGEDVDACYLFLTALSRELGHVQFFHMEKFSSHHAWVRVENGIVIRAYAWAGGTVWNQGDKTSAEIMLQMRCPDYGENTKNDLWSTEENISDNVEKVPLLAARWSIDPAMVHRVSSITGGSQQFN